MSKVYSMSKVRSLGYQLATFMRCVVSNLQPKTCNLARGFSLVELLVVIAIITFLAAAVLYTGRAQQGEREVTNAAYEIASHVRQAQTYGGATRETTNGSNVYDGYGVYIDSADPRKIIVFADANMDWKYEAGTDQLVATKTLSGGIVMKDFCVSSGGAETCASSNGNVRRVTVTYGQSKLPGFVTTFNNGNNDPQHYERLRIILADGGNMFTRNVLVDMSGLVSVE